MEDLTIELPDELGWPPLRWRRRNELDAEIRELLGASVGRKLALDFPPGPAMFDAAAFITIGRTRRRWRARFPAIRDDVLLRWASRIEQADGELRARLDREVREDVPARVPEAWLSTPRAGYVDYFLHRLDAAAEFVEEAVRTRAQLV